MFVYRNFLLSCQPDVWVSLIYVLTVFFVQVFMGSICQYYSNEWFVLCFLQYPLQGIRLPAISDTGDPMGTPMFYCDASPSKQNTWKCRWDVILLIVLGIRQLKLDGGTGYILIGHTYIWICLGFILYFRKHFKTGMLLQLKVCKNQCIIVFIDIGWIGPLNSILQKGCIFI